MTDHYSGHRVAGFLCILLIGLLFSLGGGGTGEAFAAPSGSDTGVTTGARPQSVVSEVAAPAANVALCRFGVGAGIDIADYPVNDLRIGWYADWRATATPARPGGISYTPMVRFQPTGLAPFYRAYPTGAALQAVAAANPGAIWLIGNEPDRRYYQDSLTPEVYARAYHDLYHEIKAADPTARAAAGGIVQPTPLRLQYLDRVLRSYLAQYGVPMPVDVWNIHAFILRERSCEYFPEDCWGAEIPPGIDAAEGMLYEIEDNDNLVVFKQFIGDFRTWMRSRGYQNRPLIITEFGILMPDYLGFDVPRVNAYMTATFDYLSTATGPAGLPDDDYRFVQYWAWYSLTDTNFNGPLFYEASHTRTPFGDNFAAYTARVTPAANLRPAGARVQRLEDTRPGGSITATLEARVVNTGNIASVEPAIVRFYRGDPEHGGLQIGADVVVPPLAGCAGVAVVTAVWADALPGLQSIWIVVDAANVVPEQNEQDNTQVVALLVAPEHRVLLPLVSRPASW